MFADYYDSIAKVAETDKEVADAMALELKRQRENIELIASENLVSPQVMAAMGSVLTNKYAEGLPGKRYYGGCQYVDVVEEIAIKRSMRALWLQVCQCSGSFRCSGKHCCLSCAS